MMVNRDHFICSINHKSRVLDNFFKNVRADPLKQLGILMIEAYLEQAVPVPPHHDSFSVIL
jgi:hypothetical protein